MESIGAAVRSRVRVCSVDRRAVRCGVGEVGGRRVGSSLVWSGRAERRSLSATRASAGLGDTRVNRMDAGTHRCHRQSRRTPLLVCRSPVVVAGRRWSLVVRRGAASGREVELQLRAARRDQQRRYPASDGRKHHLETG